ncbi:MAG: ZIP family metal transporter [Clostridia bacterium]|nr:ZIP family metal transporter [Clostridia bacterium]
MENFTFIAVFGTLTGVFGTTLGGLLGCFMKESSNKLSSIFLELAAGIMTAVVCFDLLPEGFFLSGIQMTLAGFMLGVVLLCVTETVMKCFSRRFAESRLAKTGFLVFIGIMLHNLPEGLAIGAGFGSSVKLGLTLALVIALHDVPEGIAITLPLRKSGMGFGKAVALAFLSGLPTGIGAVMGSVLGNISAEMIALSLGFAGGAMMYVVSGELLPESNRLYRGRMPVMCYMVGFLAGIFVTRL